MNPLLQLLYILIHHLTLWRCKIRPQPLGLMLVSLRTYTPFPIALKCRRRGTLKHAKPFRVIMPLILISSLQPLPQCIQTKLIHLLIPRHLGNAPRRRSLLQLRGSPAIPRIPFPQQHMQGHPHRRGQIRRPTPIPQHRLVVTYFLTMMRLW